MIYVVKTDEPKSMVISDQKGVTFVYYHYSDHQLIVHNPKKFNPRKYSMGYCAERKDGTFHNKHLINK